MKIDSDRLRTIRRRKKLSRPDLKRASGITARTIQRLENEPDKSKSPREDTVMRLAEALDVEPGVLTGELPLPEPDQPPASEPDPVRIGAQIPPKVRLAYDLIKRRYGVNATDVITMAPLFFALLAEGSLKQRREKSQLADDGFDLLLKSGIAHDVLDEPFRYEDESIDKADIFGQHLFNNEFGPEPFDPSVENPFANYLCELPDEFQIPAGVVNVDKRGLTFGSPAEFPDYDIWNDEIERITNGSAAAKKALETGFTRLPDIPEELTANDKDAERQQWLENRLAPMYKGPEMDILAQLTATKPGGDRMREILKDVRPKEEKSEKNEEGDDQ